MPANCGPPMNWQVAALAVNVTRPARRAAPLAAATAVQLAKRPRPRALFCVLILLLQVAYGLRLFMPAARQISRTQGGPSAFRRQTPARSHQMIHALRKVSGATTSALLAAARAAAGAANARPLTPGS